MMAFIRQQCVIKLVTTCCEVCGTGLEVQFLPAKEDPPVKSEVHILSFKDANKELDAWEKKHPGKCKGHPPISLTA